MPTTSSTDDIIKAAIIGFEVQKQNICARIAELRQMMADAPSEVSNAPVARPAGRKITGAEIVENLGEGDAYQNAWSEIDHVSRVNDTALIARLEGQMDAEFASGKAQNMLTLFTPAQRRDEMAQPDSYVFGRLSKTPVSSPYLTVNGWLAYLRKYQLTPCVEEAKNTAIHLMNEAKIEMNVCSAFECFGYELAWNEKQYVLSSGIWYEVADAFIKHIDRLIDRIAPPTIALPAWDQKEKESEYKSRCAKSAGFLHFDAKNIRFSEGEPKFEFCDIFDPSSKALLFASVASKSAGMSHLLEQARRTAELLFSADPGYRKKLAGVFEKHHPRADRKWLNSRPRNGEWKFCLVSLGRSARDLPFFAKCALVRLHHDLSGRGHEMSFIDV